LKKWESGKCDKASFGGPCDHPNPCHMMKKFNKILGGRTFARPRGYPGFARPSEAPQYPHQTFFPNQGFPSPYGAPPCIMKKTWKGDFGCHCPGKAGFSARRPDSLCQMNKIFTKNIAAQRDEGRCGARSWLRGRRGRPTMTGFCNPNKCFRCPDPEINFGAHPSFSPHRLNRPCDLPPEHTKKMFKMFKMSKMFKKFMGAQSGVPMGAMSRCGKKHSKCSCGFTPENQ
jgi:hypothetical protein